MAPYYLIAAALILYALWRLYRCWRERDVRYVGWLMLLLTAFILIPVAWLQG